MIAPLRDANATVPPGHCRTPFTAAIVTNVVFSRHDFKTLKQNMYKAAFFDIDGTLVSFMTHEVPESTRRAIKTLRGNGVKCFISSGRHLANIDNLGDLEFDGYVTVNGGMTYYDGELIDANPIARADVEKVLEMVYPVSGRASGGVEPFAVSMVQKDGLVMNIENDKTRQIFEQLGFKRKPVITDLRDVDRDGVYQMISFFSTGEEPHILSHLPNCESQRWSPIFTDLGPKGQSKVRGMSRVCEIIGATRTEIMAFGDGGNDVAMLQYAGLGVAMGNAMDDVKSKADVVCPSVDSDGIEWVVRNYLGMRMA